MNKEPSEEKLFQKDNPKTKGSGVVQRNSSDQPQTVNTIKPVISDLDNRMLYIVDAYIKKLPDNQTRKQLARYMINTIIKSANL